MVFNFYDILKHFWHFKCQKTAFMSPVSPVFHTLVTVSIGLKSAVRMMTSILQYRCPCIFMQSFARWSRLFICWFILHWLSTSTILLICNAISWRHANPYGGSYFENVVKIPFVVLVFLSSQLRMGSCIWRIRDWSHQKPNHQGTADL